MDGNAILARGIHVDTHSPAGRGKLHLHAAIGKRYAISSEAFRAEICLNIGKLELRPCSGERKHELARRRLDRLFRREMQWRSDAKKLIFLVGDAPPASRGEVPHYDVTAHVAAEQGITINAIRCGDDSQTQRAWQEVAMIGHGEFSTIRQDGGFGPDRNLRPLTNRKP